MKRFAFLVLLASFATLVGTSHSRGETMSTSNLAVEEALQQGIAYYTEGNIEDALSYLRAFVVRYYDSPLIPQAYLYLARIYHDRGDSQKALDYLSEVPEAERSSEFALLKGAALVATQKPEEGLSILETLDDVDFTPFDNALRLKALAEGHQRLGNYLQALSFLHRAGRRAQNGEATVLFERAHEILKDRLSPIELSEVVFMFSGTPIGQDAALIEAQDAFSGGDRERARQIVEKVVASPVTFPRRKEAVFLWERLTGNVWLQRSIGVLIPETGRFAPFGELVRKGMDLALELHNRTRLPIDFVYRDSAGDPDRSAELVSELANEERVMAIAGPLSGAASESASVRAQKERVPLLTLSQRKGLPETGAYIFRNSLTPRLQAQALARWAVEEKGMTSFGVLYPENRFGQEMTQLFTEEVRRRGGLVIDLQSYTEDATDYRRQIQFFMGKDPDAPEEEPVQMTEQEMLEDLFLPDEEDFPPVCFDALFIPDYAERVGMIAPQLAYYGIEDVPLLGVAGWNSPELLRVAGPFVENAVFVDGFFRFSPYPFVKEFVNLYFEKYGEEPSILEAQGFDVANILLTLLDREELQTRESYRLALSQLADYPGVTGATSFNMNGDADKVLFVLQIQNGNIVQIN